MKIIKITTFVYLFLLQSLLSASEISFDEWVSLFKERALKEGISKHTVNSIMNNANYLPKVIKYDRYQPEFYEDTYTYIKKRTTDKKVKKGISLYENKKKLIDNVEKEFFVEKELLLALMGIETNFGKYLGKMDIISSLSTLSYDKRRSEFFTGELLTLLKLIDNKIIDPSKLYGSWAGAFGNFQFMPSTIKNYAIDFDNDKKISLKKTEDSFASAANYLNELGWDNSNPCFFKVKLKSNIPEKYLNISTKNIHNIMKVSYLKKYIQNHTFLDSYNDLSAAIITPDAEIVENPDKLSPAYIIFDNYILILKWNRSLRFALAVCTLKEKFKNDL